jgi:ABC-2 type transport system ATP-binding protein
MMPARESSSPAIDVRALTRLFGTTPVLQDVTFSVSAGEIVAITGAHGAGKTTLLKLLVGHIRPSGGRIRIQGLDLRTSRLELTMRLGYVPQIRPTFGSMCTRDLLDFSGRARRLPSQLLERRAREVVSVCDLADHLDVGCARLDAAASTRVSLAQALLHQPQILILDDILEGLPDLYVAPFIDLVERLATPRRTILITGTAVDLAGFTTARLLHLDTGRLAAGERQAPLSALAPADV